MRKKRKFWLKLFYFTSLTTELYSKERQQSPSCVHNDYHDFSHYISLKFTELQERLGDGLNKLAADNSAMGRSLSQQYSQVLL